MSAAAASPRAHLPVLVLWATFNLTAALGHALLLALSLTLRRLRANVLLLNLEAVFVVATASGALLVWTGAALDAAPPRGLCLANAVFAQANPAAQTGVAFGLVTKVWSNAMLVYYPGSKVIEYMGITPVVGACLDRNSREVADGATQLLAVPYIAAVPIFIASLVVSEIDVAVPCSWLIPSRQYTLRDPSLVSRGSPFYCTIDMPALYALLPSIYPHQANRSPSGTGANAASIVFTFFTLVFAAWTAACVARSHWRVRSLRANRRSGPGSLPLILRVLTFSVFVFIAFVCAIVSLFSSFSATTQDLVVSITPLAAFFIFASDRVRSCVLPRLFLFQRLTYGTRTGHPPSAVHVSAHDDADEHARAHEHLLHEADARQPRRRQRRLPVVQVAHRRQRRRSRRRRRDGRAGP
jgi:hypothetical protein